MKYAAKNCAAVWQIEKSHTPDITVGQINSGVARCGWGMSESAAPRQNQPPPPTVHTNITGQ